VWFPSFLNLGLFVFPDGISVKFHYGGRFVRDWVICYNGGKETLIEGLDPDRWSYFEIKGILGTDLLVKEPYRLWWMLDEEVSFRVIKDDASAEVVKDYAVKKMSVVNVFVEHDVDESIAVVDVPNYVVVGEELGQSYDVVNNEKGESSDAVRREKGKGVLVYSDNEQGDVGCTSSSEDEGEDEDNNDRELDSEEERALCFEDGFEEVDNVNMNEDTDVKMADVGTSEQVDNVADVYDADWGKEYESEELDSDDPDLSGDERGPAYNVFQPSQLTKDYVFTVGMDFRSLKEFKEGVKEWCVLNQTQVKTVKQDKVRCRIVCKDTNCKFLALCSKVAHTHSFKLKTWNGDHTCGKVLENRSADVHFVTKYALDKLRNSDMKVTDIMTDLRTQKSVGVSFYVAWMAKKRAMEIIEGDARKQYTLLWRYAAELQRVSKGNRCKINVERLSLNVQPRFSRFYFCFDGCKQGFLSSCRPFIGVDGCHLKTQYGGILLVAVGRDANDQYFPLAFGVVENETTDSWRWFLTLLLEDIGTNRRWVFISDQQKVSYFF
jgi:dimeric dUTPase (all-alpha-NTP-PPase superfamily)